MITVSTRLGRIFFLLSEAELDRPQHVGQTIRSFCPIHKSDHQRSLSLHRSGWGRCFNTGCPAYSATGQATVLVVEWNPEAAGGLLQQGHLRRTVFPRATDAGQNPHQKHMPSPNRTAPASWTAAGQAPPLPHWRPSASSRAGLPNLPSEWQQDELRGLARLYSRGELRNALHHPRAQAYLAARKIPLWVALQTGMGYLPPYGDLPPELRWDGEIQTPPWWCNRLIFPVGIWWPDGTTRLGFCGRSLEGWQPGMSEEEHKALLTQEGKPRRWRKTWPGGWFGYEPERLGAWVMLVEGPFDRCALLAAGFRPQEVIALVGTAARMAWLPRKVQTVVVALDGDTGGETAAGQIAALVRQDGRSALVCLPPRDGNGKDWSERWEKRGLAGLLPVLEERRRLNLLP